MRPIDADALCGEFKRRTVSARNWKERAIMKKNEEAIIRADATLAFLSEVKLTIDNAPTVLADNYSMGYQDGVNKVLSERPHGEWKGNNFDEHSCPLCGHAALYEEEPDGYYEVQSNFCPNCGADMRGGRE